jgi:hypothetical protein
VLIALVANGGGNHTAPLNLFTDKIVDYGCGHPRPDMIGNHIKDFGSATASRMHACEIRIFIDADAILGDAATDVFHG